MVLHCRCRLDFTSWILSIQAIFWLPKKIDKSLITIASSIIFPLMTTSNLVRPFRSLRLNYPNLKGNCYTTVTIIYRALTTAQTTFAKSWATTTATLLSAKLLCCPLLTLTFRQSTATIILCFSWWTDPFENASNQEATSSNLLRLSNTAIPSMEIPALQKILNFNISVKTFENL